MGLYRGPNRRKGIDKGVDDQDKIEHPQIPPKYIISNKIHALWDNESWVFISTLPFNSYATYDK